MHPVGFRWLRQRYPYTDMSQLGASEDASVYHVVEFRMLRACASRFMEQTPGSADDHACEVAGVTPLQRRFIQTEDGRTWSMLGFRSCHTWFG
jgi:hypothetical protein